LQASAPALRRRTAAPSTGPSHRCIYNRCAINQKLDDAHRRNATRAKTETSGF
jgi:hypothetical protein